MTPSFNDLTSTLQERLLWDMDLCYDNYDSSKAEAIHMILVGADNDRNEHNIANYCKALSDETLSVYIEQELEALKRQKATLDRLKKLVKA